MENLAAHMLKNPPETKNRSPLKRPAQRLPGQSVRERLTDVVFDQMGYEIYFWCSVAYAAMEWTRWALGVLPGWRSCTLATALMCVAAALRYRGHRRSHQEIANLRQGMEGEIAVGQFLDEYCRQRGYAVIHDLVAQGFNVDHVLIGKGGVFAIETKTISKPPIGVPTVRYDGETVLVNGHTPDRDPIAEAKGCALHVAELLAETTGRKVFVRPVVLFPGWFIEGSSSGREVWVLEPKALPAFLDHEPDHLSQEDARLFASHLKTFNRRDAVR
jgi:hypothetical protein